MCIRDRFVGIREMRGHAAWYVKGLPKSHQLKDQLTKIETYEELQGILSAYEEEYARMQEQYKQGNRWVGGVSWNGRIEPFLKQASVQRFFFLRFFKPVQQAFHEQ